MGRSRERRESGSGVLKRTSTLPLIVGSDLLPVGAVTFLFTDIEGSTRLWEQDPDRMQAALAVHDELMTRSIRGHKGWVFKTGGDSFCVSFDSPQQALAAALESQRALSRTDWDTSSPIKVRMGVHTGTAQIRGDDYFGPTLNRTARIMSVGHGGQILLSSSTQRLLIDELPGDVELLSLGVHALKDLDRSEEIFQVVTGDLASEFPPLHTEPSSEDGLGGQAARAFEEKDWERVVDLLTQLETDVKLSGKQHEMMGFALWWLGRHDQIISRFEHAYNTFVAEGDSQGAASAALELAELHAHSLAADVAAGWVKRAERLLEGDEESSARGYLLRWKAVAAFDKENDIDLAISLSEQVAEIGRANMDGNLEVLALQDQGRFLVAAGRLDEGMPLMDEAMIAAVAGDVTPINVGRSYCNMLAVCDQTGDIRRAAEWTKTAEEWCQESESSPYPGVCRIFKAEMMWLNGDWVGAESEVMRASGELGLYTDISGEAWYQFGVMRVRAGDYEGAEEAFQEALTRGREPVPGYAYVLRHQGLNDSAVDMLRRSLADPSVSKLDRARFLPALAEFSLDQGDIETSRQAAEELEEIGQLARSDYFLAQAAHRRGLVELIDDPPTAINSLRGAVKIFSKLRLPYESAKARSDLAKAYIADGAQALATLELKSAKAEFERLGSAVDAELTDTLLAQ